MAKKNGTTKKIAPLPKGFTPARTRLDGFFERSPGNSVQGILKGSFQVKDSFKSGGTKTVYRIAIQEGETQIADGEMVGPGSVIGLDKTGYTSALDDFEQGDACFVRYEGLADDSKAASRENPHIFTVGKLEN